MSTQEDSDGFGLDVAALIGGGISPEMAAQIEQQVAAALSRAAGQPIGVSGARLEGSTLHFVATMPRDLAEDLGLVPPAEVVIDVTAEGAARR